MARAKTAPAPEPEPAPVAPPAPKKCFNCLHWLPKHMTRHVGECKKAFLGTGGYMVTTDLQSCSIHEPTP